MPSDKNHPNKKYDDESLRKKIRDFNNIEKPLTACSYCGGRDYKSQAIIEPALQSKATLEYKVHESYKNGSS